jgi:dienelactone hydrolase
VRAGFSLLALFAVYLGSYQHLRAAGLLVRLTDPSAGSAIANFERHGVVESRYSLPTAGGDIQVRLFTPKNTEDAPAVVLVHGLQHLGIDEPRLISFARTIAESGVAVLTPQLPGIAEYEISTHSIQTIGTTVQAFSTARRGRPVGLIGMSFSGGLALIAAADPEVMPYVAFVVAIGAHHDLSRVARFYATGKITTVDSKIMEARPHEYGPLVIVFGSVSDFFSAQDAPIAREAMRLLLYEEVAAAKSKASELSGAGKKRMDELFAQEHSGIRPALLENIERSGPRLQNLSPAGKLGELRVPVLLLHGSGDDIIPPSEIKWLEKEIHPSMLKQTLITPLLSHVDLQTVSAKERLAVVHFMAVLLQMASET